MRVEVSAAAIAANVELLRARFATPVCGVVKADGYGHGAALAARAMLDGGAEMLGVVDVAEALALRDAGISSPVLAWLHGAGVDFRLAAQHDVDVAVGSLRQLESAAEAGAAVHLKIDTGLGRGGIARSERSDFLARAGELAALGARIRGLMSHLAGTSAQADRAQLDDFMLAAEAASSIGPLTRHLANSAGAASLPEARLDMVRIGMAAYGVDPVGPSAGRGAAEAGLRPAMRVTVDVAGGRAKAGIDQGLLAAVGAPVLVGKGAEAQLTRVASIDHATLQIEHTAVPSDAAAPLGTALPHGEAVLFGDFEHGEPSVDEWAQAAGTIGYEVVTRLGAARGGRGVLAVPPSLAPRRILEFDLEGNATRLVGELVSVKTVEAGLGVSYGGSWVTPAATRLGLVALGYADGVPRAAEGRPVMLRGTPHPIRGRVAMDQVVVDLQDADAEVGDTAMLEHASVPELGAVLGARLEVRIAGEIPDADAMEALGERIGNMVVAGDTVLLVGPLGAGKTTLTRGIGRALGVRGTIQSPTFVIARTHRTEAGPDLQHVDAYRLTDTAELDDLDLDLDAAITVAEWGEALEDALESRLLVTIARGSGDDGPRTVQLLGRGKAWDAARMQQLATGGAG